MSVRVPRPIRIGSKFLMLMHIDIPHIDAVDCTVGNYGEIFSGRLRTGARYFKRDDEQSLRRKIVPEQSDALLS